VIVAALVSCGTSTTPHAVPSPPSAPPSPTSEMTTAPTSIVPPSSAPAVPSPAPSPTALAERCPGVLGNTHATTTTITTSDGVGLYAATIGTSPVGLVMAEDVPHSICEELPEAALFAQHGYRVEVFDWRDRGDSGTSGANPGRLDRDVAAAAAALRRQGSRCVALVGSYGGAAAASWRPSRCTPLRRRWWGSTRRPCGGSTSRVRSDLKAR
jgi:hypothetical protein